MAPRGSRPIALAVMLLLLPACQSSTEARPTATPSVDVPPRVLMPDLVGLPSALAGRRLGSIEASADLGLTSDWGRPVIVRCGVRPETVAHQQPAPGTPLGRRTVVRIRTAALDLEEFRGPCDPADGDRGPVAGPDAALARQFYRFAADPSLGAPFASGEVWTGIDRGPTGVLLDESERPNVAAWMLAGAYAERTGPFSALDIVAASGGYYELHRGVVPTCGSGRDEAPPVLAGLRAISLTAPSDTTMACLQWWGVTLFLDDDDRIRGVALRLGAP
jgi:hypothetical protein